MTNSATHLGTLLITLAAVGGGLELRAQQAQRPDPAPLVPRGPVPQDPVPQDPARQDPVRQGQSPTGQQPEGQAAEADASTKAGLDLEFVRAGALLGGQLICRQPLAGADAPAGAADAAGTTGPGSTHVGVVADVRDLVVAADGAVLQLVVEPTATAGQEQTSQRLLPADDVVWDHATRRFATALDAARIAALPTIPAAADGDRAAAGAGIDPRGHRLSQLRAAALRCADAGPDTEPLAARALWIAPVARRVAFVTIDLAEHTRLLPWSIVQPVVRGDEPELQVRAAIAQVSRAPVVPESMGRPTATQRQAAYFHFGLPVPAWEAAAVAASSLRAVRRDR